MAITESKNLPMSDSFLLKAEKIIIQHIENEKFGVSELAGQLNLSRSQILRKIKATTGISANQFIRNIRLKKAVELLHNEELTVSEIAYKVGFGSPSYFNKCFHDKYGYTPGDFKRHNRDSSDHLDASMLRKKPKNLRYYGALVVFLLLASAAVAYLIDLLAPENEPVNKYASIAVLPLLDLSEKKDKEYIAMGLTDAITLELSQLKNLRVTSRGSAMLFQDSVKLYADIAKKLGVDLLLEGSVIYGGDSLRVTVQLINPFPEEDHIWSNSYDQVTSNVLALSRNISNQIAEEIDLVVSPDDNNSVKIEISAEALEFYLRGKMLWQRQNPKSVKTAIEYLKQTIELEPEFAPAYSVLAQAYISMNKFIKDENMKLQNRKDSRTAIDIAINKAIELDGSLAEAYFAKGNVLAKFDWDWEGMKRMAEMGLEINNSNSFGHLLLSKYYLVKGNLKKSLQEALLAETLDPLNPKTSCIVAERYYLSKDFDKSIQQYERVLELYPHYGFAWDGIGFAQFISGRKDEAMQSWKILMEIMGNHDMARIYEEHTTNVALNYWLEEATKEDSKLFCSNPIIVAQAYMFVNNSEGALQYLERAFDVRNEDMPTMLLRPIYEPLHNNAQFKALVEKVGIKLLH